MPRIIAEFLEEFTRDGDVYRRYQRAGTRQRADIKIRHRNGVVTRTREQAEAEARRRLDGAWYHAPLAR
jgi:hypothetical protein